MNAEKETIIDVIFPREELPPPKKTKRSFWKTLWQISPFMLGLLMMLVCFQQCFLFSKTLFLLFFLGGSGLFFFIATRKEHTPPPYQPRQGFKRWGVITPCLAVISIILMMWWFHEVGIFIGIVCAISLIGIFITAATMKRKGRDPSALLATVSAKPVMIFLGLCSYVFVLAYLGRPEYISIQNEYRKNHPGQALPKDELFGFVIGETSLEEAIDILKAAGSSYKIGNYQDTDIPSLSASNYQHEKIPFKEVFLEFDKNNKIYCFKGYLNENLLSNEDILDIHRAFNYRYKKRGNKPFQAGTMGSYWTQKGSVITVSPRGTIWIENLPLEQEVEGYRNYAKRRAEEKAYGKWFSSLYFNICIKTDSLV